MVVMSGFSEYDKCDGLGLAELVRKKEVKPSDLVEEAISRIEKLNPQLNAVIHKMYELARKIADGEIYICLVRVYSYISGYYSNFIETVNTVHFFKFRNRHGSLFWGDCQRI